MFSREFECPSCGAPVKQTLPGTKTLVCTYCGQTSHLNADSLEAAGEQHLLIDYGSILQLQQQGKFQGRDFLILGRIRIDYEDGFWDEWFLNFLDDGSEGWIQEDDGSFVMFQAVPSKGLDIPFEEVKVGKRYDFSSEAGEIFNNVFVTSKSRAQVNGGEGELPFRIIPGEPADFVEGVWKGDILSLEVLPSESVLFRGYPISLQDLELS